MPPIYAEIERKYLVTVALGAALGISPCRSGLRVEDAVPVLLFVVAHGLLFDNVDAVHSRRVALHEGASRQAPHTPPIQNAVVDVIISDIPSFLLIAVDNHGYFTVRPNLILFEFHGPILCRWLSAAVALGRCIVQGFNVRNEHVMAHTANLKAAGGGHPYLKAGKLSHARILGALANTRSAVTK